VNEIKSWPQVPLGEIAKPVTREVAVIPGRSYRTMGVKWWGEGAYERETIDGSQTAARTLNEVREGDLVINKIWVRNGSAAIASAAVDGCSASGEFPTFELDCSKVLPQWLHWLTKTRIFWSQCELLSRGTSGKNRIKPAAFLTIRVPLPSLEIQQGLISRLDTLGAFIADANRLHKEVLNESGELCRSLLQRGNDMQLVPMRELVRLRQPDENVQREKSYQFAGVYSFGRGVFRGNAKSGADFAYSKLTRLRAGDFVYPKLMAWEGALGIVPPECDQCFVSTEFPVFEVIQERVLPEVLDVHFRSPSVWRELSGASTGTNVRRRRLNPTDFLAYKLPLPSRPVQMLLRRLRAELEEAEQLQARAVTELKALMPSVLSKAFLGQLPEKARKD
jgi:type I restriction enzyme S subunit